jgi:CMP-N,N'-diacetyllegionaminic acid synthase
MQVTALLTGRGNNTLRDKNVLPIFGKPLLFYTANAAKNAVGITKHYVSSDCPKILAAAESCGYEKIIRPDELALPTAQHKDAITHALIEMNARGHQPDLLVVLLANSPTVLPTWIDSCIDLLIRDPEATAAVPVSIDMDHHPYRAKRIDENGTLRPFFDFSGKPISSNRQDLPKSVFLCHNFWVIRVSALSEPQGDPPWGFMGKKVLPFLVEESFDIHDMEDVRRAERWLIYHGLNQ